MDQILLTMYCPLSSVIRLWKDSDLPVTIYYEVFFHWYKGDHHELIMDVAIKILFGKTTHSPFDALTQCFSSKDIKEAPKYFCKIYKYLGSCDVIQHANWLTSE